MKLYILLVVAAAVNVQRSEAVRPTSVCNFEADYCGFVQEKMTDKFDWSKRKGSTPSSNTGPSSDHSGKSTGYYLYIETSYPRRNGDTARISKQYTGLASHGSCLTFWYHMYGSSTGSLNIYIKRLATTALPSKRAWSKSGQQGNKWFKGQVTIQDASVNVVFEGVRGNRHRGDIAIDDISIQTGKCLIVPQGQLQCGKPTIQSIAKRVIAGKNAREHSWPWQILMFDYGSAVCGGTLVASDWVVTAAHCVSGKPASNIKIRFAEHDTRTKNKHQIDVPARKIISHPQYSSRTLDYDIALIQLSRSVKGHRHVIPACLPRQNEHVPVGTQCYITGWGKIKHPGYMHHTLQQARIPVVSKQQCAKFIAGITDRMVCAGHGGKTRKSGCHGDSGGPFVCQTGANGSWVLHGAVSWGHDGCDSKMSYSVFARVASFTDWIKQNMKKYSQSG